MRITKMARMCNIFAPLFCVTVVFIVYSKRPRTSVLDFMENIPPPDDVDMEYPNPESFEHFDNVTGADHYIVPNIVHFIRFDLQTMPFIEYLCIVAAHKLQKPDYLYIHTNLMDIRGYYWNKLKQVIGKSLRLRYKELPDDINGYRGEHHTFHYSDVARIQVLMQYGGIYLDSDTLLLKSLDPFRKYEMAIGWPLNAHLGTQLLVAHRNARFLRKWLETYQHYDPTKWYYNAGQLPTTNVLYSRPQLVHRVIEQFGVRDMTKLLYDENVDKWDDRYFAMHLLIRHRIYLNPKDVEETGILTEFTEDNIKGYDRTFGSMARWILYNTTDLLAKSIRHGSRFKFRRHVI